jgi:hypothetical protein
VGDSIKSASAPGGAEAKNLASKKMKTRLEPRFAMIHVRFVFNIAKGGDPMSHGSAQRSVLLVREMEG